MFQVSESRISGPIDSQHLKLLWGYAGSGYQIHALTLQDSREPIVQAQNSEHTDGALEGNEQVNVALAFRITAGMRAKEINPTRAESAQLLLMLPNRADDLCPVHSHRLVP